jgi:hypothetical protein
MKHIAHIELAFALVLSTALLAAPAAGQTAAPAQDQSSLGDYARKVHKDTGAPKAKPKVFDNDNLPKDDKISVIGQPPATTAEATESADATEKTSAPADGKATDTKAATDNKAAAAKPATPAEDEQAKKQAAWKAWQDKLKAQKDHIDLASRELDVTQREYQLRAAAMYADAGNRLRNSTQWDKEEAQYKQQIADKQKAVDDAKQKLSDMQEEARKDGVPASMME